MASATESQNAVVESWIGRFIAESNTNSLQDGTGVPAWDRPLVGFARGDDPLFEFLHEDIGDFYWTPLAAFRAGGGEQAVSAADLSVISWVLPQTRRTKAANGRMIDGPAEPWARSRHYGEMCNDALRRHIVEQYSRVGVQAVAPVLAAGWAWQKSAKYGAASNWSERHTAFVAGLGTFGLSDGLITAAGKAHRCGSVIAKIRLEPTPRPYTDIHEYCLHYSGEGCDACAKRCPAAAISDAGHDKVLCQAFTTGAAAVMSRDRYGVPTTPCGLCQTAVPCASQIPRRKR